MTLADQLAAKLQEVARDAERIPALSRTRPDAFYEDKDAIARRIDAIAVELRNGYGGTPTSGFAPGVIAGRRGRPIRVEVRRRVTG